MALSNKRKLQLIEARRKAAQTKKRLRLEEDSAHSRVEESAHPGLGDSAHSGLEDCAHSELEDFLDDSSISDSDTVDEGSEGTLQTATMIRQQMQLTRVHLSPNPI